MKHAEHVENTKRNISLALHSLILKKPYDEISISEICRKANVSRVSFYHYYDSKDDILIQFCDERFAQFFEGLTQDKNLTFEDIILELLRYLKKISLQLTILRYTKKDQIFFEQFRSYGRFLLYKLQPSRFPKMKDNPYAGSFLVGGVFQVIIRWIDEGAIASPETVAKSVFDLMS